MNINHALDILEAVKPSKEHKAMLIVRTHYSCFGMYEKHGFCTPVKSHVCRICKKLTDGVENLKEVKHSGRKPNKAGSTKKSGKKQ